MEYEQNLENSIGDLKLKKYRKPNFEFLKNNVQDFANRVVEVGALKQKYGGSYNSESFVKIRKQNHHLTAIHNAIDGANNLAKLVVDVGQIADDDDDDDNYKQKELHKPAKSHLPNWNIDTMISTTKDYINYGAEQIVNVGELHNRVDNKEIFDGNEKKKNRKHTKKKKKKKDWKNANSKVD